MCYLNNLLHCYEQQSVLPDEVIIVVSDVDKVDSEILNKIQKKTWKFPVKLIMVLQRLYAGLARNVGCSYAAGDIFIL